MPGGLHRTYGANHLHFITCSCYRRLPFLSSPRSRDVFLSILEQARQRYRFVVVEYVRNARGFPSKLGTKLGTKIGDRRDEPPFFRSGNGGSEAKLA